MLCPASFEIPARLFTLSIAAGCNPPLQLSPVCFRSDQLWVLSLAARVPLLARSVTWQGRESQRPNRIAVLCCEKIKV